MLFSITIPRTHTHIIYTVYIYMIMYLCIHIVPQTNALFVAIFPRTKKSPFDISPGTASWGAGIIGVSDQPRMAGEIRGCHELKKTGSLVEHVKN